MKQNKKLSRIGTLMLCVLMLFSCLVMIPAEDATAQGTQSTPIVEAQESDATPTATDEEKQAPSLAPTSETTSATTDAPTSEETSATTDAPTSEETSATTDAPTSETTSTATDTSVSEATSTATDTSVSEATSTSTDTPTSETTSATTDTPTFTDEETLAVGEESLAMAEEITLLSFFDGTMVLTGVTMGGLPAAVDADLGTGVYADITSLTISGTLNSIDFAFIRNNLSGLTELNLSGMSNTVLPDSALGNSPGLGDGRLNNLTTVTLPDGLTTIGSHAFADCVNLVMIALPEGLTTIGVNTFRNCQNLALTALPDGLWIIASYAFYNCPNLTLTALPDGLLTIGPAAFYDCYNITLTALPDGVKTINERAFYNCTGLTTVSMPGVTTIWAQAFAGCTGLTAVDMPSVSSIGAGVFDGCTSLIEAGLPNGTVTVAGSPAAGGTVWLQPTAPDTLSLTATANAGYSFNNWSGASSGIADITAGSTTYTLPASGGNVSLKANFGQAPDITNTETALSVEQGAAGTLTVTAQGIPTPVLSATLQGGGALPDWITFTPSTGEITASPPAGQAIGNTIITVTAGNGIGSDARKDFTITVTEASSVTGVTVSPDQVTVLNGGTQAFTANVTVTGSAGTAVNWSVSGALSPDTNITEGGLLTVGAGETAQTLTVTATSVFDSTKTGNAAVTVVISVTGVTLDKSTLTLAVGKSKTLTATVAPPNATNKAVKWSSSDTAIAAVDDSGKITAVAPGEATITVTTADGGFTAACVVTVVVPVTGVTPDNTTPTQGAGGSGTPTATVTAAAGQPKTGDDSNIWLWILFGVSSLLAGLYLLGCKKQRNKKAK